MRFILKIFVDFYIFQQKVRRTDRKCAIYEDSSSTFQSQNQRFKRIANDTVEKEALILLLFVSNIEKCDMLQTIQKLKYKCEWTKRKPYRQQ